MTSRSKWPDSALSPEPEAGWCELKHVRSRPTARATSVRATSAKPRIAAFMSSESAAEAAEAAAVPAASPARAERDAPAPAPAPAPGETAELRDEAAAEEAGAATEAGRAADTAGAAAPTTIAEESTLFDAMRRVSAKGGGC